MKRMILVVMASLTVTPISAISVPPTSDLIIGKWRHLKMVQTADGKVVRVQESHGESTLEYRSDGTWTLTSPRNSNSGTYRLMDKNSLESTILKSDSPNQIGYHSVKRILVDRASLNLIAIYDENSIKAFAPLPDGTRPKEMTVTSTFERISEKSD